MDLRKLRIRRKVFADCSISHGTAFAAWFINSSTYGVVRVDTDQVHVAETAAIAAALRYSRGPVTIHTDHEVLTWALKDPTSMTYKKLVVADPSIPALYEQLLARHSELRFVHGHGPETPAQMKFVDALSRATSRRFFYLGLDVGEELVSAGAQPLAEAPSKVVLPSKPLTRDLETHFRENVLPLLGRRHSKRVRSSLEEKYVSALPTKVPLHIRRRNVKRAARVL